MTSIAEQRGGTRYLFYREGVKWRGQKRLKQVTVESFGSDVTH